MNHDFEIKRNRDGTKTVSLQIHLSPREMEWATQCKDPVVKSTDDLKRYSEAGDLDGLLCFLRIYTHYAWLNERRDDPHVQNMVTRQAKAAAAKESKSDEKSERRRQRRLARKAARLTGNS